MLENIFPYIGFFCMAFWALSALALRTGLLKKRDRSLSGAAGVAAATLVLCLVPIGGLTPAGLILSFIPVFSVGSILLAALMSMRLWGKGDPLGQKEWFVFLLAGAIYGLVLVMSALGIFSFDLYSAGYGQRWFIVLLALCAACLAIWGSTLVWWPVAACALWLAGAVASANLHDLLTDVFFLAACTWLLANRLLDLRKSGSV